MYVGTMKPNIRPTVPTPALSEQRKINKWQLACKLNNSICRANKIQENATISSYEVARHGKPFSDSEFITQCLIKVIEIMCLDMQEINNVSLSRNTVVRQIEDLAANLNHQVSH